MRASFTTAFRLALLIVTAGTACAAYARTVNRDALLRAVIETEDPGIIYNPAYVRIPYPMGDVPERTGVCTDVIIRVYRKVGIDLQKEVHEDMRANFGRYPSQRIWGLKGPDRNIDHRRVPNLMTFFTRRGAALTVTGDRGKYKPGDIVAWDLTGNSLHHIGIISDRPNAGGDGYLILHNIGGGQVLDDCLFNWKIIGHYRY